MAGRGGASASPSNLHCCASRLSARATRGEEASAGSPDGARGGAGSHDLPSSCAGQTAMPPAADRPLAACAPLLSPGRPRLRRPSDSLSRRIGATGKRRLIASDRIPMHINGDSSQERRALDCKPGLPTRRTRASPASPRDGCPHGKNNVFRAQT